MTDDFKESDKAVVWSRLQHLISLQSNEPNNYPKQKQELSLWWLGSFAAAASLILTSFIWLAHPSTQNSNIEPDILMQEPTLNLSVEELFYLEEVLPPEISDEQEIYVLTFDT